MLYSYQDIAHVGIPWEAKAVTPKPMRASSRAKRKTNPRCHVPGPQQTKNLLSQLRTPKYPVPRGRPSPCVKAGCVRRLLLKAKRCIYKETAPTYPRSGDKRQGHSPVQRHDLRGKAQYGGTQPKTPAATAACTAGTGSGGHWAGEASRSTKSTYS